MPLSLSRSRLVDVPGRGPVLGTIPLDGEFGCPQLFCEDGFEKGMVALAVVYVSHVLFDSGVDVFLGCAVCYIAASTGLYI